MANVSFPIRARTLVSALAMGPVFIIFLSSNVVNAGNLLFNVLFSRWMGPELFGELATVLTIKLAILGILGALQIAVSHRIAQTPEDELGSVGAGLSRLNHICFVGLWLALPAVLAVLWFGDLSQRLGLGTPLLLVLLALSLPFSVPLSILRGVTFGRLDTKGVLLSANVEMLVRLVGSVLVWKAGFGIEGVVAVVAASIISGWVPICGSIRHDARSGAHWGTLGRSLAVASLPFALLQVSQVILLDGDVILARLYLEAEEAGYIASLSLFQRVQFFACFGLAAVLLPAVSRAVAEGRSAAGQAGAVAGIFTVVSAVVLIGTGLFPEQILTLFVGQSFLPAAPVLGLAAASAVAFTLSYLLATYLSALGDSRGIWMVAFACPVQVTAMAAVSDSLDGMLAIKLGVQLSLATILVALTAWRTLHRKVPVNAPIPAC